MGIEDPDRAEKVVHDFLFFVKWGTAGLLGLLLGLTIAAAIGAPAVHRMVAGS